MNGKWSGRAVASLGVVLLAAVATALSLAATRGGIGLTNDSVVYESTASNLKQFGTLTTLWEEPLTVFPPGVPLLVSGGEYLGLSGELSFRLLSALSLGLVVGLTAAVLSLAGCSRRYVLVGAGIAALSPVLHHVSMRGLSEPPFTATALLLLLILGLVVRDRRLTPAHAVAIVLLCWLAFLLRYAGVALIATAVVSVVAATWGSSRRRALMTGAAIAVAGSLAPLAWILRNLATDGTTLGPRSPTGTSPVAIIEHGLTGFGRWVLPIGPIPRPVLALVGLTFVAALVACGAWLLGRALRTLRSSPVGPAPEAVLFPVVVFLVISLAHLVISQLVTEIDDFGIRLLAPLYPAGVIVIVATLSQRSADLAGKVPRLVAVGALALVLVVLLAQAVNTLRWVYSGPDDGYEARRYTESPLARAATTLDPSETLIFSNSVESLWSATRMRPLFPSPFESGTRGGLEGPEALVDFQRVVACSDRPVYLVAYADIDDTRPRYSVEELAPLVDLRPVVSVDDGELFTVHDTGNADVSCDR